MVVGFFFTKADGPTLCERDEKATHVHDLGPRIPARVRHFSLLFLPSSPSPRSKTIRVEIDIDTGHWNLIHSADEPKLERGKIERSTSLF